MMRKQESNEALSALLVQMQDLMREAYKLGQRNAVAEIMKVADGSASFDVNDGQAAKGRAPRGTSQALIKRALSNGPLTAKEIARSAKTDDEKNLSFSAVYLELVRGKNEKRYRQNGSKWSLA